MNTKNTITGNKTSIGVKAVNGRSMLKEFIMLPWTAGIYENDDAWVPPIIKDQRKMLTPGKGYFFDIGEAEYFIAYKDGKPAGRISAHVNRAYEEKYDEDTGFFGFFECVNDREVARALFSSAETWLKARGKTKMNGPQSFSIYDSVGFEVFGEDILPVTGLYHFASYYKNLALDCDFAKLIDWHCVLVKKAFDFTPFINQMKNSIVSKSDVTFSRLNVKELKERGSEIKEIFNKAWEGNWGHLPLTDKQFDEFYKEISMIVVPELTIFAEKDGKTVGFIVSIPDVNPALKYLNGRVRPWNLPTLLRMVKKSKKLRTIIMGVLPEYRRKMIDVALYMMTIETGLELGYESSDCSLIVETNSKMLNIFKRFKGEIYKTYRIYEKQIS